MTLKKCVLVKEIYTNYNIDRLYNEYMPIVLRKQRRDNSTRLGGGKKQQEDFPEVMTFKLSLKE